MADSDRVRFSRQHINARCKTLVTYRLLIHLGNGVYDITREGKQYLTGELDARNLGAE
ncbi:phage PhiH1 repressor protein [Natrinema gari JCM 14663]|uniref:Phage PhiH1 repressor protein n=1 Tax=Natrinema gari JCM 14663 TaxID=1230459 RepID=L9YU06_9EURY|nr:phage PhiH1 repressor protein [Natrinema gari JCM 14663]